MAPRPRTPPSLPGSTRRPSAPAQQSPRCPGLEPGSRATPTNARRSRRAGRAIPLLLTALLALAAAPAATEQLRYTPATCSTDAEGKVYLRLNTGVAFGFPADALKGLRGEIDFEPPPVPNPADPEGCPGNPIIIQVAYVLFHFPRPAEMPTGEIAPDFPLLLEVGGADARSFGAHGYLRSQYQPIAVQRIWRQSGGWCEFTPAGWDACYGTNVVGAESARRGGAMYVAREDTHPLRSGARLTLKCSQPKATGRRECSTQYEVLPRVRIHFRFYDDVIPVEQFFDLDREITQRLQAARVPALDFAPPAHVLHRPEKDR